MKKQILAYTDALINIKIRGIERVEAMGATTMNVNEITSFKNELEDLKDFIADLKETEIKESDEIETLNYQMHNLKKDNKDWKESYNIIAIENIRLNETLVQVEKDLFKMEETNKSNVESFKEQIKDINECNIELKTTNILWQNSCNELKDKNERLRMENVGYQQKCENLKCHLKKLKKIKERL